MTRAQWTQIIRAAAKRANLPGEREKVITRDGTAVVGTIVRLGWNDSPRYGYAWQAAGDSLALAFRVSSVRALIPLVMAEVKRRHRAYYPRRGRHSWGEE